MVGHSLRLHDAVIHRHRAELVLDDGESHAVVGVVENVVHEGRLPGAEIAGQDGDCEGARE